MKLTQTFSTRDGQTFEEGHKTKVYDNYEISTSFKIEDGIWAKKRSYKWYKQ